MDGADENLNKAFFQVKYEGVNDFDENKNLKTSSKIFKEIKSN